MKHQRKDADLRRGERLHKGKVQTAVNTYTHSDGRTVTVIGLAHMAEPDYYQQVRKRVDEAATAGAVVQYENTNWDAESEARNDDELAALRALRDSIFDRYKPFHIFDLGWQSQPESVLDDVGSDWQMIDVGAMNVVRLFGPANLQAAPQVTAPRAQIALLSSLDPDSKKFKLLRYAMVKKYKESFNRTQEPSKTTLNAIDYMVIYTYREFAAGLAIVSADSDVVSMWGGGHLSGIDQVLTRNGFTLVESEWITAIH